MNRKIRRTVCGMMSLLMLFSATACSGKSDSSSTEEVSNVCSHKRQKIESDPVTETLSGFDLTEIAGAESNVPEDFSFETEAESTTLEDGATVMDKAFLGDFSGEGFAVLATNQSISFDVEFPADGSYDITVTSAADSSVSGSITIDGTELTTFAIDNTSFEDNTAEKVLITEGKHTIGIKPQSNAIYVDKVAITPAESVDPSQYVVSKELCNPNASDVTKRLYSFMCDAYGKYIISGQYASDNNGTEAREFIEIQKNFEDYPAIMGLDLIELSPSRVAHGSSGGERAIKNAEDWWINQGGIVTLCWHWNAPEPYIMKNGGAWWQGFYSEYTDIDLAKIMNGEDQEGYDLLVSDIDAIAEYLEELDDYNVPILWRPLHEAGGDPEWNNPWFWWGSGGSEAYKKLWVLMYDRLTNYHQINNLIWVWNGQNPDWYPGDEYVDIMGYDVYADAGDYSSKKKYYDLVKSSTDTNKIVAMTENGTLFDPETALNEGTAWSYFATWNGEFTLTDLQLPGEYTSMDMWEKIYTSDRVLTLGELPDLKNYPIDTEAYLAEHPDEAPSN